MRKADNTNTRYSLTDISQRWGWFLALGLLILLVGFISAICLPFATITVTIWIGLMVIVGGIFQIIHAFAVRRWGWFFYWLIAGILYAVAGVICLSQPLFAATFFTLALGIFLIAAGIVRIIVGFFHRNTPNWGWIVAAGFITAILGIAIIAGWPQNSLLVLGMFLAIDLMFQGWSLIALSFGLKTLKNRQR